VYLLDTNVVSELRRVKPHQGVVNWLKSIPPEQLFVSAVTVGEIQAGIEITREQDAARAEELQAWLEQIVASAAVLPMDAPVFQEWARMKHRKPETLIEDAMIAATAKIHRLTVATRNMRDFREFGVNLIDPFEAR
jgi:toxin FitB